MSPLAHQLLAFRFGRGVAFEGQLVGALERLESGGTMRVRDALFVAREGEDGELVAVSLSAHGSAGMIGSLVGFRLDAAERKKATERALDGPAGELLGELGASLQPGTALAVVLVEHAWVGVLGDAIGRTGGNEVLSEFVESASIAEAAPRLRAALQQD